MMNKILVFFKNYNLPYIFMIRKLLYFYILTLKKANGMNNKNTYFLLLFTIFCAIFLNACATLTNDDNVPIALSFSNGEKGTCKLSNKRVTLSVDIPSTPQIRRSDDHLKYDCITNSGLKSYGSIPSSIGAKIIASAVFFDFGIVDSITDKHREYPASYVVPIHDKPRNNIDEDIQEMENIMNNQQNKYGNNIDEDIQEMENIMNNQQNKQ